jgi:biopolymer transport protein ExbB
LKHSILQTLHDGGLTLWVLLALTIAIYAILFKLWMMLLSTRKLVDQKKWTNQTFVDQALPWEKDSLTQREIERSYAAFELDQMANIERRLPFLAVLITSAPLLGLLGTVSGMLVTFSGIATQSNEPMDTISKGISTALVTTQAGLVIAIPAAFFLALILRQSESTHLELQRQLHTRLSENLSNPHP